jgi:hypothetical protein
MEAHPANFGLKFVAGIFRRFISGWQWATVPLRLHEPHVCRCKQWVVSLVWPARNLRVKYERD